MIFDSFWKSRSIPFRLSVHGLWFNPAFVWKYTIYGIQWLFTPLHTQNIIMFLYRIVIQKGKGKKFSTKIENGILWGFLFSLCKSGLKIIQRSVYCCIFMYTKAEMNEQNKKKKTERRSSMSEGKDVERGKEWECQSQSVAYRKCNTVVKERKKYKYLE